IIPFYIPHYLISWKTFLIVLGAFFITVKKKPEPGIVLIAIGGLFLMQDLNFFYIHNIWHIFWPVVVIAIGIALIARRGTSQRPVTGGSGNSLDYIDDTAIFGGRERKIDSQDFKGGKITAIFGGSDIDFRGSDLSKGHNVLDVFILFGGTDIKVPPDWSVEMDVFSIFGGWSDNRSSALKVVPNKEKVLIIKGFTMFGGGEVKL
ncbi:MAG: LiaF-related protein, partial [Fulvivirga sp.]|nr:LiaF-related protein [Fulvivirga sp.]